jgi:hypothetical protein
MHSLEPSSGGRSMKNDKLARVLVVLGCIVLLASTTLHWIAGHLTLPRALAASKLAPPISSGLHAVFILVGWDWIVIAIVVLIVTFSGTRARKAILIVCAVGLLVSAGIVFHFLGWFIADEMLGAAGLLILFAALLFD